MATRSDFASLVPPGLAVDRVDEREDMLVVTARGASATACCPACGVSSRRVQSRYIRQPTDTDAAMS